MKDNVENVVDQFKSPAEKRSVIDGLQVKFKNLNDAA
jgi:hypothetical protein